MDSLKIKIPHNISDGEFLKLQEKGDYQNGLYGNLILRVRLVSQNNFEKMDNNLVYTAYLNFDDLIKNDLEIPHPSGKLSVKLPDDFDTSKQMRVKSKGFQGNTMGDLIINIVVKFNRKEISNFSQNDKIHTSRKTI